VLLTELFEQMSAKSKPLTDAELLVNVVSTLVGIEMSVNGQNPQYTTLAARHAFIAKAAHAQMAQIRQEHERRNAQPGGPPVSSTWVLDAGAGQERIPVELVAETPKRYRVRLMQDTRLSRRRIRKAGDIVLVPKHAVSRDEGK
jgi:hypothetical protein